MHVNYTYERAIINHANKFIAVADAIAQLCAKNFIIVQSKCIPQLGWKDLIQKPKEKKFPSVLGSSGVKIEKGKKIEYSIT